MECQEKNCRTEEGDRESESRDKEGEMEGGHMGMIFYVAVGDLCINHVEAEKLDMVYGRNLSSEDVMEI